MDLLPPVFLSSSRVASNFRSMHRQVIHFHRGIPQTMRPENRGIVSCPSGILRKHMNWRKNLLHMPSISRCISFSHHQRFLRRADTSWAGTATYRSKMRSLVVLNHHSIVKIRVNKNRKKVAALTGKSRSFFLLKSGIYEGPNLIKIGNCVALEK